MSTAVNTHYFQTKPSPGFGSTRTNSHLPTLDPTHPTYSDTISFSGKRKKTKPLSNVEKLKKTETQALKLFTENPSREKLIKALKKLAGDRLEIYDGSQPGMDWVNQTCRALPGRHAFIHWPDSLVYEENPKQAVRFSKDGLSLPDRYTDKILPHLYKSQKGGLFMDKNAPLAVLYHEAFHVLQHLNGLPLKGPSRKADNQAREWEHRFNKGALGIPFVDDVLKFGKTLLHWSITVPSLLLRKSLGQVAENPKSAGASLRTLMQRETEVDEFMLNHAHVLGLSVMDKLNIRMHWLFESKLKFLLSYQLDTRH